MHVLFCGRYLFVVFRRGAFWRALCPRDRRHQENELLMLYQVLTVREHRNELSDRQSAINEVT